MTVADKPRIGQRARSDDGIVDFHVVGHLFQAEADGVHGDVPVAQRGNRVEIDAAGIVAAVAEQHDGADGQIAVSATSCFRLSPMRVVEAVGCSSVRLPMRVARLSRR